MEAKTETDRVIDEQALFNALDALQLSRQDAQKRAFKKAYPRILNKLAEGIKETDIIKTLSEQGVLRSRNTYVKWMAEMRAKEETGIKEPSAVRDAMQRASAGRQF
ncbi:hypothetical protein J2778_002099 [Paraburkholderia graminis]|uniref:hypothetical protein n=1 Tax=Burkholderiaceae TaxID=119060 RepID=UPI002857BEF6|nr:hypothetical protein [Paraburkholderia graminis]MDR6474605.1 hypothetical protein [Paraburkholderia graminis]